jgi:hypothetical protein
LADKSARALTGGFIHIWQACAFAALLAGGAVTALSVPALAVAAESPPAPAPIPQEKLDSLLAPVALYPDQLLTQTLMAATYPLDVVAAARFVEENKDLKGEALDKAIVGKNWDPSVQSLAAYPQVLLMMNNKLDWTQELGEAFLLDEKRVLDTVQSLRRKARDAGNLKSNEQQKVIEKETVIIVEPATEVVYVPSYNPTVVYATSWPPAYPPYYYPPPPYYYPPGSMAMAGLIGFGIGVAVADNHWGWSNCDWDGGDVDIDVNRNNTFVNNNREFKNKVNNGNWKHNPAQRKGVGYNNPRTREQFRRSDPGAVSSRRDARGYAPRDGRDGAAQATQRDRHQQSNAAARSIQYGSAQRSRHAGYGTGYQRAQRPLRDAGFIGAGRWLGQSFVRRAAVVRQPSVAPADPRFQQPRRVEPLANGWQSRRRRGRASSLSVIAGTE